MQCLACARNLLLAHPEVGRACLSWDPSEAAQAPLLPTASAPALWPTCHMGVPEVASDAAVGPRHLCAQQALVSSVSLLLNVYLLQLPCSPWRLLVGAAGTNWQPGCPAGAGGSGLLVSPLASSSLHSKCVFSSLPAAATFT